jgi:ABC-type lipoprotein export system ATPase subunit
MLQTRDIRFAYNAQTGFQFPDLHCDAGMALLITGRSGKGKTTLLHLLGGLMPPTHGSIRIGETELNALRGPALDRFRGRHIGIVFQQPHFVESISVLDNILLAAAMSGSNTGAKEARMLLDQLGIADQARKKPARLSQGQRQRAGIARALLNRPALLLADEPTSSLDDENTAAVAGLLHELAWQYDTALIIVTHDGRLKGSFERQIEL